MFVALVDLYGIVALHRPKGLGVSHLLVIMSFVVLILYETSVCHNKQNSHR